MKTRLLKHINSKYFLAYFDDKWHVIDRRPCFLYGEDYDTKEHADLSLYLKKMSYIYKLKYNKLKRHYAYLSYLTFKLC